MGSNCLVETKEVLVCTGEGVSRNSAVEKAFQNMRMQIQDKITYPIIGITADQIECIDYLEDKEEEAFMKFFLKRDKMIYKVVLQIHVSVKYLQIGDIQND